MRRPEPEPDPEGEVRRIEYVRLRDLQRAPRNPNSHMLPAIASSIRRHGFVEPLILDGRTGRLIGGHGRLDVLEDLRDRGEPVPPGMQAEGDDWRVPVVLGWSSRNDAEAEALLVAMMHLPKSPIEDRQMLAEMLESLAASAGLDGTGYEPPDVDLLLAELAQTGSGTDPAAMWDGMPVYEQESMVSAFAMTVHFKNADDFQAFWTRNFGEGKARKTVWWPEHDGFVGSDLKKVWKVDDAAV